VRSEPDDEQVQSERDRLSSVYAGYESPEVGRRWSGANPGNAMMLDERLEAADALVGDWTPNGLPGRVLDIGCGGTTSLTPRLSADSGTISTVVGMDILYERLARARSAGVTEPLMCGDGTQMPIRDNSIDLVTLYTVFSSVLDEHLRRAIADEIRRVLRADGAILWYDLRVPNPSNRNLGAITRRRLGSYFPEYRIASRSITLLPPLARRLGSRTRSLYPLLARVPPLRGHLLALLRPPV
jgi:ubiquinone/menaquinone biosynthesis C-methylase UbiE